MRIISWVAVRSKGEMRTGAGLGDLEAGQLLHRRGRAVVVHEQLLEHRGRRASRADVRELVAGRFHGLVHLVLGFEEDIVDHYVLLNVSGL